MPLRRLAGPARWLLRLLITTGLVVYILVDVDTRDLARQIAGVRPALLAGALALYLVGQGLSAYKWSILGRSVGFDQPVGEYVRFYFIGMFFNLFGPSTLGGDFVRALYLGQGRRRVVAVNSVLFDRASGLALLMALGAAAVVAFPQYDLPWPLAAGIVAGGAGLVLGWWMCPRLVRLLPDGNRIRRHVETELAPFWRDGRMLARVAVVSLAFHLTQVAVQWVLARAVGAAVPFSYCLIFHPVISVMTALPVSVGGLGVREGGYLYFLTRMDFDDALAVTLGLSWFAITVLAGLVGAAFFVASGAELPRLRAKRPAPADASAA